MKVLLVVNDLYKSIGGGQTVYRKIIDASPDLEFYYFRKTEAETAHRPPNAHPIPLADRCGVRVVKHHPRTGYRSHSLIEADQIARSVAGESFDIVDFPDFYTFGRVLRDAFAHHRVNVGRIVLAMHGNISKSIEMNWDSAGDKAIEARSFERAQFESADAVYSISPRYIREWQKIVNRPVHYIDPAYFVEAQLQPLSEVGAPKKPSIYCIGRSERRKGNDLFVELVRWLRQGSFDGAAHIGDQDYSHLGVSSGYRLQNIAGRRGLDIPSLPPLDRDGLGKLYGQRSIIVLPVRYDTLNLVALEALFSGCPVAISTEAGACDYLDEFHPGLPYLKIDFDNFYAVVKDLQNLVDNYDSHRERLAAYLKWHPIKPQSPLNMRSFYEEALGAPLAGNSFCDGATLPYQVCADPNKERLARIARWLLPARIYRALRHFARAPRLYLVEKIKKSGYLGDARYCKVISDSILIPQRLRQIAEHPEHDPEKLREKLHTIYRSATNPLYRCNFWREIARIERVLGNELIAVTYELRMLRLLGNDRLGLLDGVVATLNKYGYVREAEAVQAMYAAPENAAENVYAYLKNAYRRNLARQDKPLQVLDDWRKQTSARVAVIVSLYKAADKLNYFLTALSHQTLVARGEVEIILVDSGSPTNEREVIESFLQKNRLNVVYARSFERETIQAAWNRGIGLAAAPYLVFLGVDETLYPEALEVLARELDEHPEIDWVMANSLVTEVDEKGVCEHDVMTYDRTGACKDHVYLETCYLSWVGGMYRKTLHDRFGYYDEKFGAAGDTEIKNRILPYINVKFIPKMLGLFLNYPDGQTTASPKAEIEDLRAWYMHRTPGGVRYAFENRTIAEAEKQLCTALGYRKSYCQHTSCDIEYAVYLAQHIKTRSPDSVIANQVLPGLEKMLRQLRDLEFSENPPSILGNVSALICAWRTASQYQAQHREVLKLVSRPCYGVLNDNRYEQHSWLWKSN